jgi:hypothetical protein
MATENANHARTVYGVKKVIRSKLLWDECHMAELPPRCLLVVRNVEDAESATLEPRYDIGPLRLNGALFFFRKSLGDYEDGSEIRYCR